VVRRVAFIALMALRVAFPMPSFLRTAGAASPMRESADGVNVRGVNTKTPCLAG
jgi:hypothetical protein